MSTHNIGFYEEISKIISELLSNTHLISSSALTVTISSYHEGNKRLSYIKLEIDVYETLCPQQMLVHKGGKIKNWGGECRDVTPTKSLSQNIRVDVNREVKFL